MSKINRKFKIKNRRPLRLSDFRKCPRRDYNMMLCGEHSYIDVTVLKKVFPSKKERLAYIEALIEGLK